MTQLPINPIIRAKLDKAPLINATEHEIKMKVWFEKPRNRMIFLRDGLIDTQCFPAFYGAFFVLNLERHLAGDLDEDQLDHFVGILLDNFQLPYLKAVHPEADIEGHFTALLRDRRKNSRSSYLQGRLDQYGRLPSWRRVRKGDPRYPIHDLVMRDGPFSIALGHKPGRCGQGMIRIMLLVSLNQRLVPGLLDHVQKLWAFTVGNRVTSCFGVLCFDKGFRGWADGRVRP